MWQGQTYDICTCVLCGRHAAYVTCHVDMPAYSIQHTSRYKSRGLPLALHRRLWQKLLSLNKMKSAKDQVKKRSQELGPLTGDAAAAKFDGSLPTLPKELHPQFRLRCILFGLWIYCLTCLNCLNKFECLNGCPTLFLFLMSAHDSRLVNHWSERKTPPSISILYSYLTCTKHEVENLES